MKRAHWGAVAVVAVSAATLLGAFSAPAMASTGEQVTNLASGTLTATNLAQTLIGDGTQISNVQVSGSNQSIGSFSGFSTLGASSGVVLSTGVVSNTPDTGAGGSAVPGPNDEPDTSTKMGTPGDADLDALLAQETGKPASSFSTYDAASLQFDFVATGNQVRFTYIFGSEEYPEFVNEGFNDVFGLFVNGKNCATVGANNQPVSIDTVNDKTNSTDYRDNSKNTVDTGFDGITTVLTCQAPVNQGQVNHIKFAIEDQGDANYDSGVFIVGNSFVTQFPQLTDDTATTNANTPATIDVLKNDTTTGLKLTAVSTPSHGTASIQNGMVSYTPASGYSGPDAFTYTAAGSDGVTSTANVAVTVLPMAVDDSATTKPGTAVTIPVLGNDVGTGLTVTSVDTPGHGTATVASNGAVTYTPSAGFTGTDTFTYTVTDASDQTATATASVTVVAPPVAKDDTASTETGAPVTADVLANDSGTGLTITQVSTPAHGTASVQNGKVVYTPAAGFVGSDSFTYTVTDAIGSTAQATVNVEIAPGPAAVGDTTWAQAGSSASVDVLANDTGTGLELTGVNQPSHGTASIKDGQVVYTPAEGFTGSDSFTYEITDALGVTSTGTVTVTVVPVPIVVAGPPAAAPANAPAAPTVTVTATAATGGSVASTTAPGLLLIGLLMVAGIVCAAVRVARR